MKPVFSWLVLLAALALASCEPPQRVVSQDSPAELSENLAIVIADIESMPVRLSAGNVGAARSLPHNISVLTRAIDGRETDAGSRALLRYYRGQARLLLTALNHSMGLPVDRQMAEAAIADFETVANDTANAQEELRQSSLYFAGEILMSPIGDDARAMAYYRRCADQGMSACRNTIALAKIGGTAGERKDFPGAVALLQKSYEAGLEQGCAGSYAAFSLARLTHFAGVSADGQDAVDWLRRAYRIADQLKVRANGQDVCGGNYMSVYEYLMRLEGGKKDARLLDQLFAGSAEEDLSPELQAMLAYLRGTSSASDFRETVSAIRDTDTRCEFAFLGLWKASISKQKSAARAYQGIIRKEADSMSCAADLNLSEAYLR